MALLAVGAGIYTIRAGVHSPAILTAPNATNQSASSTITSNATTSTASTLTTTSLQASTTIANTSNATSTSITFISTVTINPNSPATTSTSSTTTSSSTMPITVSTSTTNTTTASTASSSVQSTPPPSTSTSTTTSAPTTTSSSTPSTTTSSTTSSTTSTSTSESTTIAISNYIDEQASRYGSSILTNTSSTKPLTQHNASLIYKNLHSELSSKGFNSKTDIINLTVNKSYGSIMQNGSFAPAGKALEYVGINNTTTTANKNMISQLLVQKPSTTSDITFYHYNILKAEPNACISTNLESYQFCSNATAPLVIHVPVINGRYGLTGNDWYPLNITFTAGLLSNNKAQFNFSVVDLTNGTAILPLSTIVSNSIDIQENFRIPATHEIEITFSTSGNDNYTKMVDDPLTVPTNILYYLPINVMNQQSTAVSANTPIAIGVGDGGNFIGSNVIGFNA
ncbi:MAG: hypothetical protein ACREBH_01465, partial [Candidatus Micrarchaeaceae archaeon]